MTNRRETSRPEGRRGGRGLGASDVSHGQDEGRGVPTYRSTTKNKKGRTTHAWTQGSSEFPVFPSTTSVLSVRDSLPFVSSLPPVVDRGR